MLTANQIEMNGYRMGGGEPVAVISVVPGVAAATDQDAANPMGRGRVFGRDYQAGRLWSLDLKVKRPTIPATLEALNGLAAAWDVEELRDRPGAEVALRYERGGRVRRVYGRPRELSYDPDLTVALGRVPVSAKFATSDSLHYEDELRSVSVGLLAGVSGSHPLPAALPFTFAPGGPRSGVIQDMGGGAPTPVVVTFTGPIVSPSALIGGQLVAFPGLNLAFDQSVTVDTRTMTVTRNDGASLAGALSRRTYLPDVRLRPGASEVVFSGSDLTGTSRCTVAWRPAHYGF